MGQDKKTADEKDEVGKKDRLILLDYISFMNYICNNVQPEDEVSSRINSVAALPKKWE